MKRRDYIKTITLGSVIPMTISSYGIPKYLERVFGESVQVEFESKWNLWNDMSWAGPEYWGNRLQDWEIKDGKLLCNITGDNRNLHLLTIQNSDGKSVVETSVTVHVLNSGSKEFTDGCVGMILGAKGNFDDYRSASVFGKGLKIGLKMDGKLKIGESLIDTGLAKVPETFTISTKAQPSNNGQQELLIGISVPGFAKPIFDTTELVEADMLAGNFALLSDFGKSRKVEDNPSCAFEDWSIKSEKLHENEHQIFGPICFTQYTLHKGKLKLKAQLAPFEKLPDHVVRLEFKRNGQWKTQEETKINHAGRVVLFEVPDWADEEEVPFRVGAELPRKDGVVQYFYEGTIAKEPVDDDEVKVAVLNCNAHYGFPDADIHEGLSKMDYDLCVFLGDQFYESTGGYGVQFTGEFDKRCLDFLRKWMMFGWSYREIFRNKPCAVITDDHDVYHGNLWGAGGGHADTSLGFGSPAQDSGGYKMDADWVNVLQFTQTGHLPDAYDPTPVEQGISVYYTQWNYGGVSFAILEDRKFKTAPKTVLPEEAEVFNGFLMNKSFDIKAHRNIDAELLGKRQEKFLENWVLDWSDNVQMKAVLSQTNFATIATLPKDAENDSVVPKLHIPERGEYITGDAPTVDMDSNGWPQEKRDKTIEIIRKAMSFHIAGDQHLGTFVQYGVDDFGDSGYAFTGPSLNNVWPRRFWPEVDYSNHSIESPAYVGDHVDGFGNKITVHGVTNPFNQHKEPAILYNRSNGYGMVTFNKKERTIKSECFQRFQDPLSDEGQYPDWPITVTQEDNYLSKATILLPEISVNSKSLPVLKVYKQDGTLLYVMKMPSQNYQPRVFEKGKYSIVLELAENSNVSKKLKVKASAKQKKKLKIDLTA
ncbi:alkaline phosphatase D family protein [Portibacter lacus]|uniref:PhoD-like phosphatase metallophosphatase domain-containing protein n=1 Tax=Portibacter lacus TaxID=1099794 RepID=A0AA37SLZ7_9BACT|nr:alkaline phosphatase D family protein [Portibacter lacus]GLR17078.1 hypothetical protein GCM10007940_16930 [Portibacter lacus]